MLKLGSTFNTVWLGQANYQSAANYASNSAGAVQGISQSAGNGAFIWQQGY